MKKIVLMSVAALLMAATMVSCGKSTKGKMDGEWNVDALSDKTTSTSSGNSTSIDEIKISGTTFTQTSTSGNSTTTQTGTIQEATYSIKKDGTWTRTFKVTTTEVNFGITTTTVSSTVSSGNWDFANGVGEFKKNERVLFSTLTETSSQASTTLNVTTNSSNTKTYADGESTEIFVITESKKKSLKLSMKGSEGYTSGNYSSSDVREMTIELSAK